MAGGLATPRPGSMGGMVGDKLGKIGWGHIMKGLVRTMTIGSKSQICVRPVETFQGQDLLLTAEMAL